MRATPIQLAQAFATLVNGGYLIQPTVIDQIHDTQKDEYRVNQPTVVRKVFKESTAEIVREALFTIVQDNAVTKDNVSIE
jgi:stage V sporulation protein D (sporulation-specific penicillin-binding protein)